MKELYNKENNDLVNFIIENLDRIDLTDAEFSDVNIIKRFFR